MAAFLMPAHGRMFPKQLNWPSVCWDNFEEALSYSRDVLGEYPVGRGWVTNDAGPTFATVLVNPNTPSWSFLYFHQNPETGKHMVCAITGGEKWEVLIPNFDEKEKEI